MDIYSFGMSVLAMVTRDEPYSEYQDNFEKIINLASQGILPLGLKKIDNTLCVDFIQKCICLNPNERLSVEQLLEHPFLQPNEENDEKEVSLRKLFFIICIIFIYFLINFRSSFFEVKWLSSSSSSPSK